MSRARDEAEEYIKSITWRLHEGAPFDVGDASNLAYWAFLAGWKSRGAADKEAVRDLLFALREIKGKPVLRDLIKLRKRIASLDADEEKGVAG